MSKLPISSLVELSGTEFKHETGSCYSKCSSKLYLIALHCKILSRMLNNAQHCHQLNNLIYFLPFENIMLKWNIIESPLSYLVVKLIISKQAGRQPAAKICKCAVPCKKCLQRVNILPTIERAVNQDRYHYIYFELLQYATVQTVAQQTTGNRCNQELLRHPLQIL